MGGGLDSSAAFVIAVMAKERQLTVTYFSLPFPTDSLFLTPQLLDDGLGGHVFNAGTGCRRVWIHTVAQQVTCHGSVIDATGVA